MFLTISLRVVLVCAALLLLSNEARACLCFGLRSGEGFHPCLAYGNSDVVFTGLVTEISSASPGARFSDKVVRFSVDEAYKGVQGPTVELTTSPSTASCGYPFEQGRRYFVYARREQNGKLTGHLCDPTVPLESAAPDLTYIRQIRDGDDTARIVGVVTKFERRDIKDPRTSVPLPGVEVVLELERADNTREIVSRTVTDAKGMYEFRGLAGGRFRIRAALPNGPREWKPLGESKDHSLWVPPGQCRSESFTLTMDSSIRGRLVTPEGALLPRQHLALVPLETNGDNFSSSLFPSDSSLPESGSYYFHDVPPGRYHLVVNPRNTPGKSDPKYPLMYYPGVLSRNEATVIEVSQAREIDLNDFMLTLPLKERWFSGTVLLADKSPAVGAKVVLIDPNSVVDTNVTEVIANERGQFRVKGYESFPYWIDAYVDSRSETPPRGSIMYAPPVKLSTNGSVEGVELVISLTYRSQPYHK